MFKIVMPMFNAGPWLADNLAMLRLQSDADFDCLLIDDCSTDDTVGIARRLIAGDSRFDLVCNREKRFAVGSAVAGIERLAPAPDDVIVLLDGDDRLYTEDALARVARAYATDRCWLTYGSYTSCDDGRPDRACQAYSQDVVHHNGFRRERWHGSHLKTFRAHLWRHVDESSLRTTEQEFRDLVRSRLVGGHPRSWWQLRQLDWRDLLDPSGRWFRRCYDKAIMYPLLELAGPRAAFIPDVLYWYQLRCDHKPASGAARRQQFIQRGIRAILASRPPLQPLLASPDHATLTPGADVEPVLDVGAGPIVS